MGGWHNISFDPGPQTLRPTILRIMKAVYRDLDPTNEPAGIDHWWYSPSLGYQFDSGAMEPSIIILNLREGQPDNPAMVTHFMINLNTERVHDKFKDERFPVPTNILGDLETLRNQVRQMVQFKKAAEGRQVMEHRLQEERKHKAVIQTRVDYRNRLLKNPSVDSSMMEEDGANGQPNDGCILCGSEKLVSCRGCHIVSCRGDIEDYHCPGYVMDGIETCVLHPDSSYCRGCRAISGEKGILAECPRCEEWHCRDDQSWCSGRPVLVSADSSGAETQKGKDRQPKPQRLHAPKMEPCKRCLDEDEELIPFMKCSNHGCWSSGNKVCEECAPEGGMQCSNGHKWNCDNCAAAKLFDGVRQCPGCEKLYCPDCRGIKRCIICGTSTLCEQCVGADKKTKGTKDLVGAQIKWECAGCGGEMCTECEAKGLAKTCNNCNTELCDECVGQDKCFQCHEDMCSVCRTEECNRCDGVSESKAQDMVMEFDAMNYDDDENDYY